MPADYHHGVRVVEITEGTRPIRIPATAVIGFVATAADADADVFPLNKPVLVTDPLGALADAGTNGTLSKTLRAIADQANAVCVVVRVEAGADAAATSINVIGGAAGGHYTGMQALLAAQAELGVKPRILGCPGLDTLTVSTALAAVAEKLRGFAYVSANGAADKEAAVAYQENFGQREIMVIWPDFTRAGTNADAVAYALGLRAKIDQEVGWHKSISNMPVNGVDGLSKHVFWDLQLPETDAGYLNAANVTTLIRRDGFRFWGSRTCATDPLFAFEPYVRTSQVLADAIADAHLWAVDLPMNPSLVKDIIEGVRAKFRELKGLGYIIDGDCWFDPALNTKEVLKSGKLYIDYNFTPVPPLENLVFQQRITDRYLADFANRIGA